MTYTSCTICGRAVEFKRIPMTGLYAVGVDGRLVGNYANGSEAIVAALEHIRVAGGMTDRPLLPGRVRKALREMEAAAAEDDRRLPHRQ